MGNVIDERSTSMNISTFSAIQRVKYTLQCRKQREAKAYDRRGWSRSKKGGRNLIFSHPLVVLRIGEKWWRKKEWPEKGTWQSKGKWPLNSLSRLKERNKLMFVFAPLIKPNLFTVYTYLVQYVPCYSMVLYLSKYLSSVACVINKYFFLYLKQMFLFSSSQSTPECWIDVLKSQWGRRDRGRVCHLFQLFWVCRSGIDSIR